MKQYIRIIKIVAACMLLSSFFLPMSSCSSTEPIEVNLDEAAPHSEQTPTETTSMIFYPRELTDIEDVTTWLNLLAFTWPFLLIILQWRFSGRRASILLPCSGFLLSLFSAFVVYTWSDMGREPLIGAYFGGIGVLALFATYMAELFQYFRGRKASPI